MNCEAEPVRKKISLEETDGWEETGDKDQGSARGKKYNPLNREKKVARVANTNLRYQNWSQ